MSRIFKRWIDVIGFRLDFLLQWPECEELTKTLPLVSRQNFGLRIDCFDTYYWYCWEKKHFFMPLPNHPHTPQRSHVSPLSEATLFKFKLNKARWNKKLLWYVMPLLISPVGQTNSFPFVEHPAWDKPYITTVLLIQGCHSQSACCLLYQSGSNTKDLSLHCHRHH